MLEQLSKTGLLLFDISYYLYVYINPSSSIIYCLFSGDIYLSFGILASNPVSSVSDVLLEEDFCYFIAIQIIILLPIRSGRFSCFLNYPFYISFKYICSKLFSLIKEILAVFATFLLRLFPVFLPILLAKKKSNSFYKYTTTRLN